MEERKFATVLFADFVDSTALGGQHDPEVVRAAFGRTFSRMRDVLVAHGGTVEKFIGDAVMAVFGVPIAHEDDALRAVRAAFALRDHLRDDPGAPIRIGIRVGVNTGEVVAGAEERRDFLVTGQPVNLGSRLQSSAEPGQILVGALTHELTASLVRYGDQIAVNAKGAGTIAAWPALAILDEPATVGIGSSELVDRIDDMSALLETYERVRSERRPYLVTVHGIPGIGKSRLASEFAARATDAVVRRGRCVPYGDAITYAPLQSIVRTECGIGGDDDPADAARMLRATVASAFGTDAEEAERVAARLLVLAGLATPQEAMSQVPQESVAQELDWALRRYLEQRAAERPVVLVFEDVHWAEPALLDTIEHLAEWARGSLLLLCLARPELFERTPAWGGGRATSVAIALRPLSADDTAALVARLLPKQHEASREQIARRSEGNPLYAEELVRHLVESGGRATGVPATLQGLIAARLDAADASVKALLQRASVIGRVFWTDALGELGEDRARMRDRLADAIRHDFVVDLGARGPGGGWAYRFAHALTRDVAYASLAKSERSALHDRFGRWLESVTPARGAEELETVAFHAERAYTFADELSAPTAPALGRRAFELLIGAARTANDRADYRSSGDLFRRAIPIGERTGADQAALVEARGRVAIVRLRFESSREAFAEVQNVLATARQYGNTPTLASLLHWSAMYAPYAGTEDAQQLHREAVEVARALGDPVVLAGVLRGMARGPAARGALAEERDILLEARALLGQGDRVLLTRVLLDLANNAVAGGDVASARRYLDEAMPLASDVVARVMANRADADLHRATGERREAVDSGELALAAARELGSPSAIADGAVVLGAAWRELGDGERSRAVLEETLAAVEHRAPDAMLARLRLQLARTYLALGSIDRARALAADASAAPLTDIATSAALRTTRALIAAADGDSERAASLFAEADGLLATTGLAFERDLLRAERDRALARHGVSRSSRAAP